LASLVACHSLGILIKVDIRLAASSHNVGGFLPEKKELANLNL
jgi:hypothetical protein